MARTIQEIQDSILTQKEALSADATISTPAGPLNGLNGTSATSVWRAWIYIIAVCHWVLENLFDSHKAKVQNIIDSQKPHTLQWYCLMAKAFQYGNALLPESDVYPSVDADTMIVTNAAAQEVNKGIRIKVAKTISNSLVKLNSIELAALSTYMALVRDAGVRLDVVSNDADTLILSLTIYYNPLVLDGTGIRLDGTDDTPVKKAVIAYVQNLPFNGLFIVNKLIEAVEAVDGVQICVANTVQTKYIGVDYSDVEVEYLPEAGYMTLDANAAEGGLTVSYLPHGAR